MSPNCLEIIKAHLLPCWRQDQTGDKVVPRLPSSCLIVVPNLSQNCRQVVPKLSRNYQSSSFWRQDQTGNKLPPREVERKEGTKIANWSS